MTGYQVTDDPAPLEALPAQDEAGAGAGADSRALGQYAVDHLGIGPPRRLSAGGVPSIVMQGPPGATLDQPGTPVWALDLGESDPDDDCAPTEAGWDLDAPQPGDGQGRQPGRRPIRETGSGT